MICVLAIMTSIHMPFPTVGFVEKHEQGYRFAPETYQFEI
jgi:hypothetical protein